MSPSQTAPSKSLFPSTLDIRIHPPNNSTATPNILILLPALADTAQNLSQFGKALDLPETTCITITPPYAIPQTVKSSLGIVGNRTHWADELSISEDSSISDLNTKGPFTKATKLIAEDVIRDVLIRQCGYVPAEIFILGHGQGGSVAVGVGYALSSTAAEKEKLRLGGILAFGGVLPSSSVSSQSTTSAKTNAPLLLQHGTKESSVSSAGIARTKETFAEIEVHSFNKEGDTLPQNREEVLPLMKFFGQRLRSRKGVPKGFTEVGRT